MRKVEKAVADQASVLDAIRKSGATKVKVAAADIDGILRGKYMHIDKFLSAVEGGFGFCDVVFGWDMNDQCYDNTRLTGWHCGYPDALARLDLGTYRTIPWENDTPFFLGNFVTAEGEPHPLCPRQILKRVLARAEKMGFQVKVGAEYEFFNFRETPQSWAAKKGVDPTPLTEGMFGYSLLRVGANREYFTALMDEMEKFGIMPSFMAKWHPKYPGCSGHVHQSLSDGRKNLFHDPKGRNKGMSKLFESYLAGQLAHLMEFAPMFWPTVNSYKRLVDGFWAPVKPTWGVDNRTASFRVLPGSPKSTRIETRCPGADMNAYLAIAACIAAGLEGVARNMKLTTPAISGDNEGSENIPRAPRTLIETTRIFKGSKLAREWFGSDFVDHYAATRDWEWRQWLDAVTDWERQRYFEII